MANKAGNISYTYWVFPVLLLWKSISPPSWLGPPCHLITPSTWCRGHVYVEDCKSGVGLGLFYPCVCRRKHCPAYRRCSDSMCQMNNTAGSWALGSSPLGCQQQPYLNHKKKWCCFPKDTPANIINSNWAQTRRKTEIEQGCSSPHCTWSSGRGTFVKFKENCLQKIHFA